MRFIIEPENGGMTIKEFLRREAGPSRKLLNLTKNKPDGILINGARMTVRYILKPGDVLDFNYETAATGAPPKNDSLLDLIEIAYEDDYILCVNKPPDMPSHPSFNHLDDTLANAVAAHYFRQNKTLKFHPVNRLDKDTSGLVLIAKDKLISAKMNALIKNGEIKKVYSAIVTRDFCGIQTAEINTRLAQINGAFEYDRETGTGRITAPVKRARDSIIKRVCAPDGDYSVTDFKFIKSNGAISRLEVYPQTGRTHQIRVHFHAVGAPLLGDGLYTDTGTAAGYNIKRHALHAKSLEFVHPVSKSNIKIECGLPEDMKKIIELIENS